VAENLRLTTGGLEVVHGPLGTQPLRLTTGGIEVVSHSLLPARPVLSVDGGGGVAHFFTSPFFSLVALDEHLSTLWLITEDDDPDYTSPTLISIRSTTDLTELSRDLPPGDYRSKVAHEGVNGDSPFSVERFFTVEPAGPRADAPTLTNEGTGPGFALVGFSAMTHEEGVTTAEEYGEDNDLPFPVHARLLVATAAAPNTVIREILSAGAVVDLKVLADELPAGDYSLRGEWFEGKYSAYSHTSEPLLVTVPAFVEDPVTEEENVTYTVACDGKTLTIELDVSDGTDQVWWHLGRANAGGAFDGNNSFIDAVMPGAAIRHFPLLDEGVRIAVRWWRRVAGAWMVGSAATPPFVICETPDAVPVPFFQTPPGDIVDDDFNLNWEHRGPVNLWEGRAFTYRIRHSLDLGGTWDVLEEDHASTTFLVDFVAGLEEGVLQLIEVVTKSADNESPPTYFAFRKGDPAALAPDGDFKALAEMPASANPLWAGAGSGTDRTTWAHEPGVGITARRDATSPLDFEPGVLAIEAWGQPLQGRGVLTISERVIDEGASVLDRFTPIFFLEAGIAFVISGTGADKAEWAGLLLRRRSSWGLGHPYSGNARAPNGGSGSAAGVNAEFNRINFGSSGPFIYGVMSNLASHMLLKRTVTPLYQHVAASSSVAAQRWFPTNRVHGARPYIIVFEVDRRPGGWEVRLLIAGPGAVPNGWLIDGLVVNEQAGMGGQNEIPCGFCGLSFMNPVAGGESQYHSLMLEPSLDCIEDCPPIENEPRIEDVQLDKAGRCITIFGNEPDPNDGALVRYMIFAQGEYEEPLGDSEWIPWSEDGFQFCDLPDDVACYILRYGWSDPCGVITWAPPRQATLPARIC
jgi:hypothetical protein